MKMLLRLIVTLLFGGAASATAQEVSKITPYETVIKQTLDTMDTLTKSLKSIRDENTAKSAKAELGKAAEQWQAVQKKSAELPPPSKEEKDRLAKLYKTKLEEAQKNLFGEAARVRNISGGPDVLLAISSILDKKAKK
jgi:hypothetical protein